MKQRLEEAVALMERVNPCQNRRVSTLFWERLGDFQPEITAREDYETWGELKKFEYFKQNPDKCPSLYRITIEHAQDMHHHSTRIEDAILYAIRESSN
jgi:hypothetical protein